MRGGRRAFERLRNLLKHSGRKVKLLQQFQQQSSASCSCKRLAVQHKLQIPLKERRAELHTLAALARERKLAPCAVEHITLLAIAQSLLQKQIGICKICNIHIKPAHGRGINLAHLRNDDIPYSIPCHIA